MDFRSLANVLHDFGVVAELKLIDESEYDARLEVLHDFGVVAELKPSCRAGRASYCGRVLHDFGVVAELKQAAVQTVKGPPVRFSTTSVSWPN